MVLLLKVLFNHCHSCAPSVCIVANPILNLTLLFFYRNIISNNNNNLIYLSKKPVINIEVFTHIQFIIHVTMTEYPEVKMSIH